MSHLVATINQHYPDVTNAARACATVCAVRCISNNTHPTSLIYVGPPSAGKSMVLEWLTPQAEISDGPPVDPEDDDLFEREPDDPLTPFFHRSDKFTAASFVSQHGETKKKNLHDIDLLPKIKDKTLITPELAPVFAGRKDDLVERLSMLVRVLDGQGLVTDAGTHGSRGYAKPHNFQWLGATTPLSIQVLAAMSKLGPRILYYEIVDRIDDNDHLLELIGDGYDNEAAKKSCRNAMIRYVLTLYREFGLASVHTSQTHISPELANYSVQWARAVCALRTGTVVSKETPQGIDDHEDDYTPPVDVIDRPERPFRVSNNFARLIRASCIAHGRTDATSYDLAMIRHIALSSGIPGRCRAFAALLACGGKANVAQILEHMDANRTTKNHVARNTVLHYMQELIATDLADVKKEPGRHGTITLTLVPHLRDLVHAPQYKQEEHGKRPLDIGDVEPGSEETSGPDTTLD